MRTSRTKGFVTVAATFGGALAIGFVMQNGDVLASRIGVDQATSANVGVSQPQNFTPVTASGFIEPSKTSSDMFIDPVGNEHQNNNVAPDMMVPAHDHGAGSDCEVMFEATPAKAAMVTLTLDAPCDSNSLVTIQHQGMKFNEYTDDHGHLTVAVPALSKEAFFAATLEDGAGFVALTGVPDLALFDRVVLQWSGSENLQLHARETGGIEETSHVWLSALNSPEESLNGDSGFMTPLGNAQSPAPLMVQVYTYPTGMGMTDGSVTLTVEAEVTQTNCGRTVGAQSIQIRPNSAPAARSVSLQMPPCGRLGEQMVLKNTFEDLTLASR